MASADLDFGLGSLPAEDIELASHLALSAAHARGSVAVVEEWLAQRRYRSPFEVVRVPLEQLAGWRFAGNSGDLIHHDRRFFSVEGLHVRTDYGRPRQWWQPIINQPDCGILGILAKKIDGVLRFLMQAKMEPGNVNVVQISPTVQATSSNYLQAHNGGKSRYIEYFTEPGHARVLVDLLQSEQGSWFRGKRNRNIVMEVSGEIPHHEDFIWLTLGQILDLLRRPNLVNMDTRTVLSCLPLAPRNSQADDGFLAALRRSSSACDPASLHPLRHVRSWLTGRKAAYYLATRQVPLSSVVGWQRNGMEICHQDDKYFSIVGVRVHATNREVDSWCQPLLAPRGQGLVAFVVRRFDGVLHVLARADMRPGYRDVIELGPTVQCAPANFHDVPPERRPAFLDLVRSPEVEVRFDALQSEEGGRFQHAVTRHLVVEVGDDFPSETSPDFCWLTVGQLMALVGSSYQVNVEARSLLLCLHSLL
jgi:NDP-hexose 2,3-dehydratase